MPLERQESPNQPIAHRPRLAAEVAVILALVALAGLSAGLVALIAAVGAVSGAAALVASSISVLTAPEETPEGAVPPAHSPLRRSA